MEYLILHWPQVLAVALSVVVIIACMVEMHREIKKALEPFNPYLAGPEVGLLDQRVMSEARQGKANIVMVEQKRLQVSLPTWSGFSVVREYRPDHPLYYAFMEVLEAHGKTTPIT